MFGHTLRKFSSIQERRHPARIGLGQTTNSCGRDARVPE
jgi:hypothetical protein